MEESAALAEWRSLKSGASPRDRCITVRGTARLFYLLESKMLTFETPEKSIGTRKEIEGKSAQLVDFKTETGYSKARFRIDGRASMDPPVVRARLEGGRVAGPFQSIRV